MGVRTPYEILIAEKLQQYPVPDMADAIWAGIEQQLDTATAPGSEDAAVQQLPRKGFIGMKTVWLLVIAGALLIIAILVWRQSGNKKAATKKTDEPAKKEIKAGPAISDSSAINQPPGKRKILPLRDIDNRNIVSSTVDSTVSGKDSVIAPLIPFIQEKLLKIPGGTTIAVPDSAVIVPPLLKKPKGVKGIKDSDYKIKSGKKD